MKHSTTHARARSIALARFAWALYLALIGCLATPLTARAAGGIEPNAALLATIEEAPATDTPADQTDPTASQTPPSSPTSLPPQAPPSSPASLPPQVSPSSPASPATQEPVEETEAGPATDTQPEATSETTPVAQVSTFAYKHDPRNNPKAMKDIIVDANAIYGFAPSPTGSLKGFADYDWSDPAVVEEGRRIRIAYHESLSELYEIINQMTEAGANTEAIARAVSTRRNELRLEAYKNDPEGLAVVKARNLEEYGNENGGTPEFFFTKYGSWALVIEKALNVNSGMDACTGLYDDYLQLYVAVGQVLPDPDEPEEPNTETPEVRSEEPPEVAAEDHTPASRPSLTATTDTSYEAAPIAAAAKLPATGDAPANASLIFVLGGACLGAAALMRRKAA